MAKQDLYKTAQQSAKLFKLISENEQLEGWVSKKITKAAEDIESVYQYLNFEKHFKEQERSINSNTSLSESAKDELRAKLAEAKDKVAKMKIKAAKNKSEKMEESAFDVKKNDEPMKVGGEKKTRTGVLKQVAPGVQRHTNTSYKDEEHGQANTTHAKAKSASDKKKEAPALKKSKTGTWGMEGGSKFDNRKKTNEAKKNLPGKQEKLDVAEPKGKIDAKDLAKLRNKKNIKEAIARAQIALDEGKKKKGDGNLANNAKPYDKVTRGDVIAGRLGKDEKGGKKEVVKESVELNRLKFLTKQLNG